MAFFKKRVSAIFLAGIGLLLLCPANNVQAAYRFANFKGRPPIHQFGGVSDHPTGLSPDKIKAAYGLPATGGKGTIAIIGAYNDVNIEKDLNIFSKAFNLPACTTGNGCFTKHLMGKASSNSGWAMETSLDVEWSHAIAPQAKILLVEAKTPSGKNLLDAIDYARQQPGVVAISMSWGGAEFSDEAKLDSHFQDSSGKITFFASSGDNGAGASWPAASPYVVGVGGTHINFSGSGSFNRKLLGRAVGEVSALMKLSRLTKKIMLLLKPTAIARYRTSLTTLTRVRVFLFILLPANQERLVRSRRNQRRRATMGRH